MISKKRRKQFGKVVFQRESYSGDGDEVLTTITIQVDGDGQAHITTEATYYYHNFCGLDRAQILEQLADLDGAGLDFSTLEDEEATIREWLAEVKSKMEAA